MRKLLPEEVGLLRTCVGACTSDNDGVATEEECRIISLLHERGLVVACYCDGNEFPHAKVTPLGLIALVCAKVLT